MFVLAPVFAFAQSTDDSVEDALRTRITELEQKVEDLEELVRTWKARAEASAGNGTMPTAQTREQMQARMDALQEKRLERLLRVGMSGEDVRALQEALAKEPGVYPEGLVTGYYGPLTEEALRRLKAKHNLEEEGMVFGPKMQAFLNQWLRGEGVKNLPAPGQMMRKPQQNMDPRIEALLKNIRAGKRGEELKANWKRTEGDGVKNDDDSDDNDDSSDEHDDDDDNDGEDGEDGEDGDDGEDGEDGDDN